MSSIPNQSAEEELLARYEAELKTVEERATKLRRMIAVLRTWDIKWRSEIRRFLQERPEVLVTSGEMAGTVAENNDLPSKDRNTRVKISTTLSLMYREKDGGVGRIAQKDGREYLYGSSALFEENKKTLKPGYQHLMR